MRKPKKVRHENGEVRWRVRYRSAGRETSETFVRENDANTFSAIMGNGRDPAQVADALAWLAARQSEAQVATFADWFDVYVDQLTGITERTRADYRALHRRYLTSLDRLPLPLITRAHVAAIVNDLDRRDYAPKTIKNVLHLLSSVMSTALDEGHITRNPVRRVKAPQRRVTDTDTRFLTADEFVALLRATPDHYKPLVAFLVGSGLRWSEATALQTRHVDLRNGTVRVARAWKRVPGGWEIGVPKTAKSNRTVNPAALALAAIAPLLGKPDDLVFTTPRGNVVRHSNFYNRIWKPSCERAGLDPAPSPHDCRHTFASWLLSEGTVGLEAVQDQLGHESFETTRKVYAKLLPAVGFTAGRAASAALRRALTDGIEPGLAGALGWSEAGDYAHQPADADGEDASHKHHARGRQDACRSGQ